MPDESSTDRNIVPPPPAGPPPPPGHQDRVLLIGKIGGFLASVAFMAFAIYYISHGGYDKASNASKQLILVLLMIASGPITYFWVSANNNFTIDTPVGRVTLGGCYAVAVGIAIIVFTYLMPKEEERHWQCLNLQSDVHDLSKIANIDVINQTTQDHAFYDRNGDSITISACFEPSVEELNFTFKCILPNGRNYSKKINRTRGNKANDFLSIDDQN